MERSRGSGLTVPASAPTVAEPSPPRRPLPPLSMPGRASPLTTIGQSVLSALEALVGNKLRALLTILGIIIGVGAVIVVIAIG